MLTLRQLIPPLTVRGLNGDAVRAWDFKQKKNLLIAFLHGECAVCQTFASRLAAKTSDLLERDTVALLISVNQPKWELDRSPTIVLASDTTGRAAQEYLGAEALGAAGLSRLGVFVTDRYGELVA